MSWVGTVLQLVVEPNGTAKGLSASSRVWYDFTMALKTTWTTYDGRTTFFLPDRDQHEVPATYVDRPDTVCRLVDEMRALNELERDVVVALLERSKRR